MSYFDHTSNDNTPFEGGFSHGGATSFLDSGDSIGKQDFAKNKAYSSYSHGFSTKHMREKNGQGPPDKPKGFLASPITFFAAFSLWVAALVAVYMRFEKYPDPLVQILILSAGGWASLLFSYVSKYQRREFFRDLSLSTMLGTLMGAVFIALTSYNTPINFAALTGGFAFIATLLAVILKERYLLTIANMATLSWTAYSLQYLQTQEYYWAFPALLVVQIALAIELRAKIPLALASLSGLFWLVTNLIILTLAVKISLLMAISAVFVVGLTYSRFGKSMQDNQIFSGLFQTNIGWVFAIIGALLLQDYWLMTSPRLPWSNLSALTVFEYPLSAQWIAFVLICIGLIGLTGLFRLRANRQTLLGGIGIVGFSTLLPLSIIFKPQILQMVKPFNIAATPAIGLCIGGAITGLALGMLANGMRRGKPSMMLLALITLSIEAIIVMDSVYAEPDNLMLFGFSVLIMSLTAGLYAHNGQRRDVEASHA